MCIAIANKKNRPIKKQWFMNSWENNSHGGGLLWAEKGKVHAHYELTDKEALYRVYSEKVKKSNVLLHMRITSKGAKTVQNCHPFLVHDKLGFIHNGTIYKGLKDYGKEDSDTHAFNEQYLKQLPSNFFEYPKIMEMLEETIGYSKVAMMDGEGNFHFLQESKGHWNKDNWFSNDSYKQVNSFVYKGNEKVYKTGYTQPKLPPKKPVKYHNITHHPSFNHGYSWSEEVQEDLVTDGFARSILDIVEAAWKYTKYTNKKILLAQFITIRGQAVTIRKALTDVFYDFLYDTSEVELCNCFYYYHAELTDIKKKAAEEVAYDEAQSTHGGS